MHRRSKLPNPTAETRRVTLRRLRTLLLACVTLLSWVAAQPPAFGQSAADAAAPTSAATVPAARQADNVAIITIRGPIDIHTARSVERRIGLAERSNTDAIVIDLDTPGGEVHAVIAITNAIRGSSITNTVAWINPDAISGGAIIALACREIVYNDPARMGDALVITLGLGGLQPVPRDLRSKFLSPVLADVVDSARRHGYDEYLVQGFVSQGIELWQVREIETGNLLTINENEYRMLFEGVPIRSNPIVASIGAGRTLAGGESGASEGESAARRGGERPPVRFEEGEHPVVPEEDYFNPATEEVAELIASVSVALTESTQRPTITPADRGRYEFVRYVSTGDGPLVVTRDEALALGLGVATVRSDAELEAFFSAQNLRRLDFSWSESLVRFMTSIPVRGVLIVVFILGFFIEMTSPGTAIAGSIAAIALVGLIAPPFMIGMAGWWEIAAITLGIIFILCEIFVLPGFGIFGILGMLMLFGGLVGTFVPNDGPLFPDSPQARSDLLFGVATVALAVITSLAGIWFISKHFATLPLFSRLVLQDAPNEEATTEPMLAAMSEPAHQLRIGDLGVTTTPLHPGGTAEFDDQLVEAAAELGFIDAGTKVRVVRIDSFGVIVEPADDAENA